MKYLLLLLISITCIFSTQAQSKDEKINVSYWYVFGRFPNSNEMSYWRSQAEQPLSWYITNHKNYLSADDPSNTQAVTQSYKDAFGRNPSQGELDFWKKQKRAYADLMNQHVQYLIQDPAENKATINRAYQSVYSRAASADEIAQWSKGNFSYLILTACLNSYKTSGYKLQSVEGIVNFMKNAWGTSVNFVVNAGTAVYNAAASAVTATVAAGQKIITLATSQTLANDIQSIDSGVVGKTEGGQTLITGGGGYMKGLSQVIGLNGATLISDRGAGLIAAGGLN